MDHWDQPVLKVPRLIRDPTVLLDSKDSKVILVLLAHQVNRAQ